MGHLVEVICEGVRIEPPLGKALFITESGTCKECFFYQECTCCLNLHETPVYTACKSRLREDGKDVIFKLVDWPGEDSNAAGCDCAAFSEKQVRDTKECLDDWMKKQGLNPNVYCHIMRELNSLERFVGKCRKEAKDKGSQKSLRWEINSYDVNDYTLAYFVECPKCVTDYGYAPESGSDDFFERHKYCPSCGVRLLPGEGK